MDFLESVARNRLAVQDVPHPAIAPVLARRNQLLKIDDVPTA